MMLQTAYRPVSAAEAQAFIDQQAFLDLITWFEEDCQVGLFNPIQIDGEFYLHLNRTDPQIEQMRNNNRAKIVFQEVATTLPSYWSDEHDGSMATMCYRYVEMLCIPHLIETVEEMMPLLGKMLKYFQPEGGYTPLSTGDADYVKTAKRLCVVKLTPVKQRNKWKMVQNKSEEIRGNIIDKLQQRNLPNDKIAAEEIAKTL